MDAPKKKIDSFGQNIRDNQDPASEVEGYTPEVYSDITADAEAEEIEHDMENRDKLTTDESL